MSELIVSTSQMYKYDKATSEFFGISEAVLMERAALSVVDELEKNFKIQYGNIVDTPPILILCGSGNNGGDGFAIARLLLIKGYIVHAIYIGDANKASVSNVSQKNILEKYLNVISHNIGEILFDSTYSFLCNSININIYELLEKNKYAAIIDSIFGIGINRKLPDDIDAILEAVNKIKTNKVAIDIPSGINADGMIFSNHPFLADATITFGFKKISNMIYPARNYCGNVILKDIGINKYSILNNEDDIKITHLNSVLDFEFPNRPDDGNKGTFKKLLIIAGSKDIYGAALLATLSAFKTGIGMIMVLTHENNKAYFADKCPESMMKTYSKDYSEDKIREGFKDCEAWADGILIGPGIGTDLISNILVDMSINFSNKPLVIDADGLNILARYFDENTSFSFENNRKVILTPHLKEFERLSKISITEIKNDIINIAHDFSIKHNCTLLLKDAINIVATCNDKNKVFIIDGGNNGMATAGSGDVLAGICSVLNLQMNSPGEAACASSFIHIKAGNVAKDLMGERGMVAGDIADALKLVWDEIDLT